MRTSKALGGLVAAALLAAPSMAGAEVGPCPGHPDDEGRFHPNKVIAGEFDAALQGSYVMVPFRVGRGATAVRVRYCFDQPDVDPPQVGNTLDLGLYEARSGRHDRWDADEFRGWGGSSHPDVTVAPNGFSPVAEYEQAPKAHRVGHTTRGYRPGRIPAGLWAAELGLASITPQWQGDADGKVAWRLEVQVIRDRRYADRPYRAARYDRSPARRRPGWYAGDMHVHAEHSALGDATMRAVFDYAFAPLARGGAGLDFVTLSDYVTDSGWGEIGRHQRRYPRKLVVPSSEVVTYRGHANNHGSLRYVDHRTGPVYVRGRRGGLRLQRAARGARGVFRAIRRAGGWTQVNHPTIFPSQVPGFSSFCRGCSWDYGARETRWRWVDAIEVATGPAGLKQDPQPGPNPFTALALDFYERALATGAHIAAVGSSDSHHAGEVDEQPQSQITQSPIGQATTVVRAGRLSLRAIRRGVRLGRTYVKLFGNDGPDLRFNAASGGRRVIFGGRVAAPAEMRARVRGAGASAARPGPNLLVVLRNGAPHASAPVTDGNFLLRFRADRPGRYMLVLLRQSGIAAIEAVSTPIWVTP